MAGVAEIVERVLSEPSDGVVRVGIDGFCAAGKTTLAERIEAELALRGRPVIRATGDDFQHPPEIRYQLGKRSAEGFFRHAMDFESLRRELLLPLGPGGSLRYRTSTYDVHASKPNVSPSFAAQAGQVLLLDGLFLHVPELAGCFEVTVFVSADYTTCVRRAIARNQERISDPAAIEALYRERYIPGFQLYVREVHPETAATLGYATVLR